MAKAVGKLGRVIRRYRVGIPIEDFQKWEDLIRTKNKGCGLYALYRGDELKYVGRAKKSIRSRISKHRRDPNKAFTHFSVFLVTGSNTTAREQRIIDLEALLLNIIKPIPQVNNQITQLWNNQITQFMGAKELEAEGETKKVKRAQ